MSTPIKQFSPEIKSVLDKLKLSKKPLQIVGNNAYRESKYITDFDIYQTVKNHTNITKRIQKLVKNLLKEPNLHITDIKLGEIPDWIINWDNDKDIRVKIDELYSLNVLSKEEVDFIKTKMPLSDFDREDLSRTIKPHVVRWSPDEILDDEKTLCNGRVIHIKDVIQLGLFKIDVAKWIESIGKYLEFEIIYLGFGEGEQRGIENVAEDIKYYNHKKKYFKVLKRLLTYHRLSGNDIEVEKLSKILNTGLGNLHSIIHDINNIINLIQLKGVDMSEDKFDTELNNIVLRLNNSTVDNKIINKIINIINQSPSSEKNWHDIYKEFEEIVDEIEELRDNETKKQIPMFSGSGILKDSHTAAAESYKKIAPNTIGSFKKIMDTSTMDAYVDEKDKIVLVASRGTKPNELRDLIADVKLVAGKLTSTPRFDEALKMFMKIEQMYSKNEYEYVICSHSLGGAISRQLRRLFPFIDKVITFNSALQPQDILKQQKDIHSIYVDKDPLHRLQGRFLKNKVVIPYRKKMPWYKRLLPVNPLKAHSIDSDALKNYVKNK